MEGQSSLHTTWEAKEGTENPQKKDFALKWEWWLCVSSLNRTNSSFTSLSHDFLHVLCVGAGQWPAGQVLLWLHTWSNRTVCGEPAAHQVWQHQGPAAGSHPGTDPKQHWCYFSSTDSALRFFSSLCYYKKWFISRRPWGVFSLFAVTAQRLMNYSQSKDKSTDLCFDWCAAEKKNENTFSPAIPNCCLISKLYVALFFVIIKSLFNVSEGMEKMKSTWAALCFCSTSLCCCHSSMATQEKRSIFKWHKDISIYYTPRSVDVCFLK